MSTTNTIKAWRSASTGGVVKQTDLAVETVAGVIVGDSAVGGSAVAVYTAGALVPNDLVYVSGWNETLGVPAVTKADNDAAGKQAQFVVRTAIAAGASGLVFTAFRSAADLNTNAGNVGDPVYLDATAGGWTLTPPTGATAVVQIVGHIAIKSATVGVIVFDLRDFPTVGTNDIQAKAITAALMADATITTTQISASAAITGSQLAAAAGIVGGQLASGAGVAAILTAGLGGSASKTKTYNATGELVAAHGSKDRAVLVVAVVDETFADAGGNQPTFTIGEADTLNKFFATGAFTNKAAGTVLVAAGTNTATKNISVTGVQAVGAGTGGITVTVLAIPTT